MNLVILADGSSGDVLPYIALVQTLLRRGWQVRFATSRGFASDVQEIGAEYFELGEYDSRDVWRDIAADPPTHNLVRFLHHLRTGRPGIERRLLRIAEACEGADAVVASTSTMPAVHVALKDGIPVVACHLSPIARTKKFPRAIGPFWAHRHRLGSLWNRLTHSATDHLIWHAVGKDINRWRVGELKVPPISRWSATDWLRRQRVPTLFGFSPSIVPKPPDWPDYFHVTGYWFRSKPRTWVPDKALLEFLSAKGPVVFAGFGSQVVPSETWLKAIIPGILKSGARALVGKGWSRLENVESNASIHMVEEVPYEWLFPRVDAVIHHCGAGTAAEALRAGVPSVCLPFTGEQRFWAARLREVSAAPAPFNPASLRADRIARALRQTLDNADVRLRTKQLGSQVALENGTKEAADWIERYSMLFHGPLVLKK